MAYIVDTANTQKKKIHPAQKSWQKATVDPNVDKGVCTPMIHLDGTSENCDPNRAQNREVSHMSKLVLFSCVKEYKEGHMSQRHGESLK